MNKLHSKFEPIAIVLILIAGYCSTIESAFALDAAGEGRRAWLKFNCYGCHGMRAGGGMGPRLAGEGDDVLEAVMYGEGGGMPAYQKYNITTTDAYNITQYLRTINLNKLPQDNPKEPYFMHWWEPVPLQ